MAILNNGGHLVLINIVLCMRCNFLRLNIYYQAFKSSFYPPKSQFVHFLLKRRIGILYFNDQVTFQ